MQDKRVFLSNSFKSAAEGREDGVASNSAHGVTLWKPTRDPKNVTTNSVKATSTNSRGIES
eukprot:6457282-Amphidinium_carterae.2